jgi:medium-chain acyl-[acyl-carrier-protein] hydrolase
MMQGVLTKQYQVRLYEADFRGALRPVAMLNYLQDTAAAHSSRFGYSIAELLVRNMTWVLSRYHISVRHYPSVGDTISVSTWRSAIEGMFALRDFEVSDSCGNILATATSSWVIMNLETKRPVKLETVITDYPLVARRALTDDFAPLPRMENHSGEELFKVRIADLDMNRHVNHTVYVEWALECIPREIQEGFCLAELEVGYRAEAFYGDTVLARVALAQQENPAIFWHQLVNQQSGKELTRLKTTWKQLQVKI